MGCSISSSKREVYSYTSLPQETANISNKQSNLTPKGTRERRTNKTQSINMLNISKHMSEAEGPAHRRDRKAANSSKH